MNDGAGGLEGDAKVDQTIQWARESLRRRRIELQEKKKSLIATYKEQQQQQHDCSSAAPATDVHAMLERGRALLAEAEAHSEILGRYISPSESSLDQPATPPSAVDSRYEQRAASGEEVRSGGFMERFLQETNDRADEHSSDSNACGSAAASSHSKLLARDLPLEAPDWGDEGGENDQFDHDEDLQELLREGEARARLDELIATVRRQGDGMPRHVETPPKTLASFDPSAMKAAKRAALKKARLDEEVAAAEEEARMLTSFKALPLPGGVQVKNDLFAPTQSFQLKQIGSVEKLVRRDTQCDRHNDASSSVSGTFGGFDAVSMVTSRTSHDNSFSSAGYENEADRDQARQLRAEKKMKKRQLLDAVNQIVMKDSQRASAEDDASTVFSEGCDIVEDPSKLRQDIARLEAKLKQKKNQRLATLNDIVDIDLNALFDRLLAGDTGDDVRHIVDRLKVQACGSVNDFEAKPALKEIDFEAEELPRRSLFRRHEEWARQREQKLFHARIQLEAEAMDGVTGQPELSYASRSWKRAKESHDENLKRFAVEEGRKTEEKEAKENAASEAKRREMEELQREANSRLKSLKSEVNKEEQLKRLEMLSRPRQTRELPITVDPTADMAYEPQPDKSEIFLPSKSESKKVAKAKKTKSPDVTGSKPPNTMTPDKKPDEFCGKPSFSEMSDKDFAKLVRRISAKAQAKAKESPQKAEWET